MKAYCTPKILLLRSVGALSLKNALFAAKLSRSILLYVLVVQFFHRDNKLSLFREEIVNNISIL